MGYIKESKKVDFVVDSKPLTEEDRRMIREAITCYKLTGRKKRGIVFIKKKKLGTRKKS